MLQIIMPLILLLMKGIYMEMPPIIIIIGGISYLLVFRIYVYERPMLMSSLNLKKFKF